MPEEKPPADAAMEAIKDALQRGKKIEAIKQYRDLTGKDLKSAKEDIERAQREMFGSGPGQKSPKKPGCGGTALLAFSAVMAGVVYRFVS